MTQAPNDVLDYTVSWSAVLESGETIVTTAWRSSGLSVSGETNTTTSATAFLSGGGAGERYQVFNLITTTEGRTYERYFHLTIAELT